MAQTAAPEATELLTQDGAVPTENLYLQSGSTLYKVSTVYRDYLTAVVCLDTGQLTTRTRVRTLGAMVVGQLTLASDRIVNRYHGYLDGGPR